MNVVGISAHFHGSADGLVKGVADLNELSVDWPIAEIDPQSVLSRAADRVESGLKPDVYPVVAEVHELTVRAIKMTKRRA